MAAPATRPATRKRRRTLFEEAAAILALEHADPPGLEVLTRRVAASPRQLQRAFAEAGHNGPRSYLRQVRIRQAAALIEEGMTVQEAARAVGYRQPAQFAKAFYRQQGELPSSLKARAGRDGWRSSPGPGGMGARWGWP